MPWRRETEPSDNGEPTSVTLFGEVAELKNTKFPAGTDQVDELKTCTREPTR